MIITAKQTYTRQAPRKIRLVANAVKSLPLTEAFQQLGVMQREASIVVLKVLRQAVANATHNHNLQAADLVIKTIMVDSGSNYKRFNPVSRGRAHAILKKTSHVTVQLMTKPDASEVKLAPVAQKADAKTVTSETAKPEVPAEVKTAEKAAAKKTVKKKATK